MGGDWVECALADACSSIDYGLTASAADHDAGPKFLRITDIVSGHIDWEAVPHVAADEETAAKYKLHDGDIVLARTGASTGASAYVKNPPVSVFASYLVRLKVKPRFDSRFVAYYLKSNAFWSFIRGVLGDKSAQPNASASTMIKAPFRAPQHNPEQRAIAHILGTLDDKIELNRRMNETLEAMARALFKSWFVDFDPARAKRRGEPMCSPQPGQVSQSGQAPQSGQAHRPAPTEWPQHILDLFPDRLVDSELGEIPEGWEVGTLKDRSSLNAETWSKKTRPLTINYVDLSNTKWGRIEAVTKYPQEEAPSRAQRVLRPGDTIVGTVRPGNGSYAFVSEDGLTGSTGFAALRPTRAEFTEFVYLAATQRENIEALSHLADGGAYPAVRPEAVAETQIVGANADVLKQFSRYTGPLLAKAAQNGQEARTLAALRDTLLQKLISGELRVDDAVKFIGRAS